MELTTQTTPTGYKQTEIGMIPTDWDVRSLENFVKITSGESPSRFSLRDDGIPYFKVEQLNVGIKYQKETPYYIRNHAVVPKKSLIFPKRGASILLNKIKILSNDSFMDTNLMTLTVSEELDNEYLYYALLHFGLWKIADTTSIPQINNKHINPLLIALPPTKTEQSTIAVALSDIDVLIEKLESVIEKKKNIKQGAMQELLTGKRRLPGFSGEWEKKELGDVAQIKKGQLITDTTRVAGSIPVIAGGKAAAYFHNMANRFGKTITISGSGASAGYVAFHADPIFASDCSTIEDSTDYSVEFVYFFLKLLQEKIYKMQTGGAQPHVHPNDLNPISILVPKIEEQKAIATVLSDMDTEIEKLEFKLSKYQNLKQGMMQVLLTGKIRLI